RPGNTVAPRERVGRVFFLQCGVFIQVIEYDLWYRIAFQDDDEPLAGASGSFIPHIGDAGQFAFIDQFGDAACQVIRVGHVWQFGDYQCRAVLDFFYIDHGAHGDGPAPGAVGLFDSGVTQDLGTGWEVWALDAFQEGF